MKKNAKRILAALVASVSLLALAACGGNNQTPAGTASGSDPTTSSTPASSGQNDQLFIGLAMHNQIEDWAVQYANTFRAEAEAAGAKASAIAVTRPGAADSIPAWAEIES